MGKGPGKGQWARGCSLTSDSPEHKRKRGGARERTGRAGEGRGGGARAQEPSPWASAGNFIPCVVEVESGIPKLKSSSFYIPNSHV